MSHDLPPKAIRPDVPAGTAISHAVDADRLGFWCSAHGVRHDYDPDAGNYVAQGVEDDDPYHLNGVRRPGDIPASCGDPLGHDPAKYPHAGPGAVARATAEVLRERRRRGT